MRARMQDKDSESDEEDESKTVKDPWGSKFNALRRMSKRGMSKMKRAIADIKMAAVSDDSNEDSDSDAESNKKKKKKPEKKKKKPI